MNPVELPDATDPGQPLVLTPWAGALPPMAAPRLPGQAATPHQRVRWLHAAVLALLLAELLPLGFLLWYGPRDDPDAYPVPGGLPGVALMTAHSLFVATLTTAGTLLLSLLAACQLTRHRHPASQWLWQGYLGLLLVPTVANIVPLVPMLRGMRLDHSLWALVLVGIAGGQAVAVCTLRQAMEAIPRSLLQRAEIDCINPWQQLRHVLLPACAPTLGVLAILSFVGSWNEFLLPMFLFPVEDHVLGQALVSSTYLPGDHAGYAMRTYLLVSLPVILLGLWTLRTFVRALTTPFARN